MWLCSLAHLLYDLLEFRSHLRYRLAADLHPSVNVFLDQDIDLSEVRILRRIVIAKLSATAFFTFQGRASDRLRNHQKIGQVKRRMPTGVVFAIAGHSDSGRSLPEPIDSFKRALHFVFLAHDP